MGSVIKKSSIEGIPQWLIYVSLIVSAHLITDILQCQARGCSGRFQVRDNTSDIDALDQSKCGTISTVPYQWMLTDQSFECSNKTRGDQEAWEDDYNQADRDDYDMYYRRRGGRYARGVSRGSRRVGGGFKVRSGQYPSHVQVWLTSYSKAWACGGVLVHNDLALTVAQCVERHARYEVTVIGGSLSKTNPGFPTSGQKSSVTKICIPDAYDSQSHNEDWALVKLDQPFTYSDSVQPACLELNAPPLEQAICVGTGTGASDKPNNNLKGLLMKKCNDDGATSSCYKAANNTGMLCQGDSGSPLYCYDNCQKGKTKMYAVGLANGQSRSEKCSSSSDVEFYFTDMYKNRDSIVSLLSSCLNKTVGSYERRYRWDHVGSEI